MRKNIVFYTIAFLMLLVVFLFFNTSYRQLSTYSELTNRHNTVHSIFHDLLRQINNAAILNPDLVHANNNIKGSTLFFTDSDLVIQQLDLLKVTVRDSVNIKIAAALDTSIRTELPWLLKSNLADSIIDHKSPIHIASFQKIVSLIDQGIKRTVFLIDYRRRLLDEEITLVRMRMTLFIVLSAALLIYTTVNLFSQQSKRKIKELELETVMNRINDAIVSVDNNWRYTFLNDAAMATHPLSKVDTIGNVIWDVHPEMKGTVFWDKYHEAMLTKKVVEIDSYYAPMDIHFSVKVYPSADGLTIFYKDVTESKRAEQQLENTLKTVSDYKYAIDESSIVAVTDQKGIIQHANDNFCRISKFSRHELIGQDHRIINSGYHDKAFLKNLWKTIASGTIWKGELKNKAKDGTIYWVDTTIVPFLDEQGKPYQYVAIRSDITERKELEEKQALFSLIVNSSDDAILSKTLDGIITSWNHGAEKAFGYTASEIIGKHISILIPPLLQNQETEIHDKIRQGGIIDHYETERVRKDKKIIKVSLTISPIRDLSGNIIGASKISRDITETKKAEARILQLNEELDQKVLARTAELLESRNQLKQTLERVLFLASIADNIQDPVISTNYPEDNNPIITRWNKPAEELLEWKSEEVIGKRANEIFKTGYPNETREQIFETLKAKGFWQGEVIYHTKSGVPVYVLSTISYLKNAEGNITGHLVLIRDITKRKKAEEALRQLNDKLEQRVIDRTERINRSEKQYRYLFQNNPMPMWVIDLENFKFLDVNEVAVGYYGYSREEFLSMTAFDIRPDEFKEAFENSDHTYRKINSDYYKGTWSHRKKDGTIIQADVFGHEILFEEREARLILTNDVTEQKKAQEKLLSSEKRFRKIIENNYDIISLLDKSFNVFYRSPSAARITGWSDEEMKNIDGTRNIHPDDLEAGKKLIAELMVTPGKPFYTMFRNKHKNGHYFWVEGMLTNMLHDDDIKAIVFNFRDVTERVEAQEKLIKSEKIYKTIASSIPGSVICLLDGNFRYLLIEGDMLEKLGYSKDTLLGNKAEDVLTAEIFASVKNDFIRAFAGEIITNESNRLGYDTISKFIPLKDENNIVYAIMTVSIDVTELKNAQRNIIELNHSLEEKIIKRTSQLEAVNKELEAFTYSVSHDLRAPLRAVNGYAQMLEEDYSKYFDNEGKRLLGVIKSNATRMGTLIDELLEFSRLGRKEIKRSFIDMNLLVKRVVKEMEESAGLLAKLNIEDLYPVMGDQALMSHVFVNLISNAIKYSSNNPEPIIRISSKKGNGEIIFTIEDNGVGFDMTYVHKLFGVFQRLHSNEEFSGTGVGLAIVQRIVNKHGGKVWATAELNKGAVFSFSIPQLSETKILLS